MLTFLLCFFHLSCCFFDAAGLFIVLGGSDVAVWTLELLWQVEAQKLRTAAEVGPFHDCDPALVTKKLPTGLPEEEEAARTLSSGRPRVCW